MMTAMIECGPNAGPLQATLAGLVPGAVDGLLREVMVVDRGLDEAARNVADHAGCRIVRADALQDAVAGAKGDWLLLLEPGARLAIEWIEDVSAHLADVAAGAAPRAARFSRSRRDRPNFLRRMLRPSSALNEGLILPKAQAFDLVKERGSLEAVARGLRIARLAAAIHPRPEP